MIRWLTNTLNGNIRKGKTNPCAPRVHPDELGRDDLIDVLDGLEHALPTIVALIPVP